MTFTLPELPYAYDALGPYMSKETLEFHHDKHHKAYVDTGNKLLEGTGLEGKSVEEVLTAAYGNNQPLFNNAGQHYNHIHFWQWMKPNGGGAVPGEGPAPAAAAAAGVAAHGRHGPQRRRPAPVVRCRRGAGRARRRLARRVLRGEPGRTQPHPRLRRRARPQRDRRGTQQHHLWPRWRRPPPQGEGSLTLTLPRARKLITSSN